MLHTFLYISYILQKKKKGWYVLNSALFSIQSPFMSFAARGRARVLHPQFSSVFEWVGGIWG